MLPIFLKKIPFLNSAILSAFRFCFSNFFYYFWASYIFLNFFILKIILFYNCNYNNITLMKFNSSSKLTLPSESLSILSNKFLSSSYFIFLDKFILVKVSINSLYVIFWSLFSSNIFIFLSEINIIFYQKI